MDVTEELLSKEEVIELYKEAMENETGCPCLTQVTIEDYILTAESKSNKVHIKLIGLEADMEKFNTGIINTGNGWFLTF